MAIALVQSNAGGHATGTTTATTSAVGYTSNTTANNLLVLIAWAIGSSSTLATPPPISTPVTSGFTWTLAKSATWADTDTIEGGRVSIYYIENAAQMLSSTTTTVTATKVGSSPSVTVEFSLYEFSGVATSSSLETSASTINGSASDPSTANLSISNTDLIISAYQSEGGGNIAKGSAYTLGVNAAYATAGQTQYILNQAAGSVNTAWGSSQNIWGCAAVAFTIAAIPATATPSGVTAASAVNAPTPLQIEFANPDGVTVASAVGTVTLSAGSNVPITGVSVASAVGISGTSADSTVAPIGVAATFALGDTEAFAGPTGTVIVTGVRSIFYTGVVSASADGTVTPAGVTATFAVGSAIGSTVSNRQIIGGAFQDCAGNPFVYGYLTFRLNSDARAGKFQINSGRIVTVPLDANGNVQGAVYLWPNDQMTPDTVYILKVYSANGQMVMNTQVTIPSGTGSFDL